MKYWLKGICCEKLHFRADHMGCKCDIVIEMSLGKEKIYMGKRYVLISLDLYDYHNFS